MAYTQIKVGDSPNLQYKQYTCDSVHDLGAIPNPIEGSIAFVAERGRAVKYIYIGDKWVKQVLTMGQSSEDSGDSGSDTPTPTPTSIEPDWNENNSESPNFIKNRTHYAETTNSNIPLSYEFNNEQWMPIGEYGIDENSSVPLIEGQEYTVIYNNQEYQFIGTKLNDTGIIMIGNTDLADEEYEYTEGDFPFVFAYAYDEEENDGINNFLAIDSLQSETITFSIVIETTTYHKISKEFLPTELPNVTAADNGSVLTVVNGEWGKTSSDSYVITADLDAENMTLSNVSASVDNIYMAITDGKNVVFSTFFDSKQENIFIKFDLPFNNYFQIEGASRLAIFSGVVFDGETGTNKLAVVTLSQNNGQTTAVLNLYTLSSE